MRFSARAAAVLVAGLIAIISGPVVLAAEEKSVLEVTAGLGSASTKWNPPRLVASQPYSYETPRGGALFRARALLTVPVSPRLSALLGATYEANDVGWLDEFRRPYFAAEKVKFAEFGFRVRL